MRSANHKLESWFAVGKSIQLNATSLVKRLCIVPYNLPKALLEGHVTQTHHITFPVLLPFQHQFAFLGKTTVQRHCGEKLSLNQGLP